ncbi:hypothetical protein GCM10010869_01040 [Mesorhizobium tianshanense]|uniref:Uncharacterized protein n=1 Tax=Mesorhizobium tianshanense TaxID=39844 RepID=A0A562NPE2_9HYPH|nr:hypothetical protein IQ26_03820 [Mesorhizobium tianshanense]GLS34516.1 hypothetical protein GCM10010869_01040 [Mesorhizobium tianshanense]
MPVRRRTDRRRDGMPVAALRRVWDLWQRQDLTSAERDELERMERECHAAGYDPLLAWCSSQP